MQNINKLNSQIPVKNNLDLENDYLLMTAQDKNIQKDYIVQGQELVNIIANQVQQQVFAKIKSTNSTIVTQYGDSLWVTYDDTMLRDLIVRNSQQVGQIADMFNTFDPSAQIQEEVALGLDETNAQVNILSAKVESFQDLADEVQSIVDEISGLNLEDTLRTIQTAVDNLQTTLTQIDSDIIKIKSDIVTLKTSVTTAVSEEIKRYYDDALGYVDQQIEFSQTTISD